MKTIKIAIGTIAYLFLSCFVISAQIKPADAVKQMGRGINLGNTLEAPNEGEWNKPAQEYFFDDYKAAGFSCIRIPVKWDTHTLATSPYTINSAYIKRVEQIVDWGLARGLFIIINAHHEEWIKTKYSDPLMRARYDSIWSQVATHFKDKSEKLLFEVINEPKGLTQAQIDDLNPRIISIIRKTNPTRNIIYSGHEWSNADQLLSAKVPVDNYLIGYFHSYDPYQFGLNGVGTWGTANDYAVTKSMFDKVKAWSSRNNIPVIISEFGSMKKCEYNSRMRHYAAYTEQALAHDMAFQAWDDYGDFAIYDRTARKWNDLKDIIINTYSKSPNNFTLKANAKQQIELNWSNRTSQNDSVFVDRRTGTSEFVKIGGSLANATSYIDTTSKKGNTYYYRLRTKLNDTILYSYSAMLNLPNDRSPYLGTAITIPNTIETENFDFGGELVGYHDTDLANTQGKYRPNESVDIEDRPDGGFQVGYLEAGEWMEYSIDVPQAGTYTITSKVASLAGGGKMHFSFGGVAAPQLSIPITNSWTTLTDLITTVNLKAGKQLMRVTIDALPAFNLDKFVFELSTDLQIDKYNSILSVSPNPVVNKLQIELTNFSFPCVASLVSISGQKIRDIQLEKQITEIDAENLKSGVYVLQITDKSNSVTTKFIKK